MYAFFLDKTAQDSQTLQDYLQDWKQKNKIAGQDFLIENVDQITTICTDKGREFSTVVAVGGEDTFQAVVGESKNFEDKTVLAYIPTSTNDLTKRIAVRDYKEACEVIAQRKIIELTALSVNSQYFLFNYEINIVHGEDGSTPTSHIHLDKAIQLDLPTDNIILHNRYQELLPHNSPLIIEGFSKNIISSDKRSIFKLASHRIGRIGENEKRLQLRMPATRIRVDSEARLVSGSGKVLKKPLNIGLNKRPIRLIVKRGQEMQAVLSPGLIS